jgi:hypothetical protein
VRRELGSAGYEEGSPARFTFFGERVHRSPNLSFFELSVQELSLLLPSKMDSVISSVVREAISIVRRGASTAPPDWTAFRGSLFKKARSGRIFVTARVGFVECDGPFPLARVSVQRSFDDEDAVDFVACDFDADGDVVAMDAASSAHMTPIFEAALRECEA